MQQCCEGLSRLNDWEHQLMLLAPCPPSWKQDLLLERGTYNNVSWDVIDRINQRCRLHLQRNWKPQDESICVGGCKVAAALALALVVIFAVIGMFVWKLRARRNLKKFPRVKIRNPVVELKNKIELSIFNMDSQSILSWDSGQSNHAYSCASVDEM